MLKVNTEKIIERYSELINLQECNLAEIEKDATAYAEAHGYDEEKTARFVEFTQGIEGNGLSDEENAELEFLDAYIEEEEDIPEETTDKTVAETNSATATVSVL